uniref:Putative secreted protein n=1 Tax=Anopheles marajoara TaxID=58244 RepID=A0A2M4C788_9DIPT
MEPLMMAGCLLQGLCLLVFPASCLKHEAPSRVRLLANYLLRKLYGRVSFRSVPLRGFIAPSCYRTARFYYSFSSSSAAFGALLVRERFRHLPAHHHGQTLPRHWSRGPGVHQKRNCLISYSCGTI